MRVRIVVDYLCDDEASGYCNGDAEIEDGGRHVFGAVLRLERFADELEQNINPRTNKAKSSVADRIKRFWTARMEALTASNKAFCPPPTLAYLLGPLTYTLRVVTASIWKRQDNLTVLRSRHFLQATWRKPQT